MEFRMPLDEPHTSSPPLFSPKPPSSVSARRAPPSASVRPVDFGGATSMDSNAAVAAGAGEAVRYHECLRNHAASRGGHVVDGCGEFMPSGGGATDALKCAACGCHRSFHRKESESESTFNGRVVPLLLPPPHPYAPPPLHPQPPPPPPHKSHLSPLSTFLPPSPRFATAQTTGSGGTTTESSSEERNNTALAAAVATQTPTSSSTKKRYRTKFTAEQKEKMLDYAEKVGWRVQRYDDVPTEQLCTEIGVSRHVLKVWMHNNKHNMKRQQPQGEADQQ